MSLDFGAILISGIAATAIMSSFMYACHGFKLGNGDMVRALGSLFTRRVDNALLPGLVIHLASGIFFAYLYSFIPQIEIATSAARLIHICTAISFFHGLAFCLVLAIVIAEKHPVEKFRRAEASVIIVHLVAHVVYGVSLGALFSFFIF